MLRCRNIQATSSGRLGYLVCPSTVLLRIEFTASTCFHAMGELLPRLSTLTAISGGIFLLHLSEGHPWRMLSVILAHGARTFLTHQFSLDARDCSINLLLVFYHGSFSSQYFKINSWEKI